MGEGLANACLTYTRLGKSGPVPSRAHTANNGSTQRMSGSLDDWLAVGLEEARSEIADDWQLTAKIGGVFLFSAPEKSARESTAWCYVMWLLLLAPGWLRLQDGKFGAHL